MIFVVAELRRLGRNVSWMPVRSSFVPKYVTIDTKSLIALMVDEGSSEYLKKVRDSKDILWDAFFDTSKKVFNRKDYTFHGMIKTDGVGVSIIFHRSDLDPDHFPKESEGVKELYVDDEEVRNVYRGKDIDRITVVGIDVGTDDLIYCTDGSRKNFFRYTANQRRLETRKKKYATINEGLKVSTVIDGKSVKEWETDLSRETRYAIDVEGFKRFLAVKLPLYHKLQLYYHDSLRRKLRWNTYINTQKSEAKMINNFKRKYGSDAVVAFGDWDQGAYHMRGKEPTKGKGLRMTFRRAGFKVYLVDEFRTSCKCHNCGRDTEKFLYRENHKPVRNAETYQDRILVHGLLRCKSSANECGRLWNRDVNGCLNIQALAVAALKGAERPEPFRRAARTAAGPRKIHVG